MRGKAANPSTRGKVNKSRVAAADERSLKIHIIYQCLPPAIIDSPILNELNLLYCGRHSLGPAAARFTEGLLQRGSLQNQKGPPRPSRLHHRC